MAAGRFTSGDVRYGLKQGGVGIGRISADVPGSVRAKVLQRARAMGAPAGR